MSSRLMMLLLVFALSCASSTHGASGDGPASRGSGATTTISQEQMFASIKRDVYACTHKVFSDHAISRGSATIVLTVQAGQALRLVSARVRAWQMRHRREVEKAIAACLKRRITGASSSVRPCTCTHEYSVTILY